MRPPAMRALLREAAGPAFVISAVAATFCTILVAHPLGVFLGGLLIASLIAPPLVLAARGWTPRLFIAGSVLDGVGLVWLVPVFQADVTLLQWLACYLVLAAVIAAAAGVAIVLHRAVRESSIAAAITVVALLAWLTWPVWLSPWLAGTRGAQVVSWLTPAHPALAVNGKLIHLGIWGEQRLAYRLTSLGQDVPYQLPVSVLPTIALHGMIALGCLLLLNSGKPDLSIHDPDRAEG